MILCRIMKKIYYDFAMFEMILLHRKLIEWQNLQKAYKKQTLVEMNLSRVCSHDQLMRAVYQLPGFCGTRKLVNFL